MRKIMDTVDMGKIDNKDWYIIDAEQAVLGRLASKIATILKGKHKPSYLPYMDNGDYIVVINAKNLSVTGNKLEDKVYYKHTGYIGNMKKTTLSEVIKMKTVIIMGSTSDEPHAKKITEKLDEYNIEWEQYAASAHKQPLKVLEILEVNKNKQNIIYITIAGRSNALSGFVAANSEFPTIGCPPFSDKSDMLVNIHSTLQMPSQTPVLTVIDPGNCALAVKRIFGV